MLSIHPCQSDNIKQHLPVFVQASDNAKPPPTKKRTPHGIRRSMISQEIKAGEDSGSSLADLKLK